MAETIFVVETLVGTSFDSSEPKDEVPQILRAEKVVDITGIRTKDPKRRALLLYCKILHAQVVQIRNCFYESDLGEAIHIYLNDDGTVIELMLHQAAQKWFGIDQTDLLNVIREHCMD